MAQKVAVPEGMEPIFSASTVLAAELASYSVDALRRLNFFAALNSFPALSSRKSPFLVI